jgi:hypothetical protein
VKKTIKRSASGLYWSLFVNGRFVGNFDRKWQAEEYFLDGLAAALWR